MEILDILQSGRRGIYVSLGGRYGQISRAVAIPANPRTDAQMDVRRTLGNVTARWRTLTEPQRNAWRVAAQLKNTVPRLGQSGALTGAQLFTKINCSLATLGGEQVDAPPSFPQFPDNPVDGLVITNLAGVIALKLGCAGTPGSNTTVRASAPCSQGLANNANFRILGVLPAPVAGACDITSLYTARYGSPPVGTKVFVEVNQNIDGWEDIPVKKWAIVPATT